jgi:YfiH family protein
MIHNAAGGLVFYQFESLVGHPEVQHAIFARLGGQSQGPFASLNVGSLVGDNRAAVQANHELIYAQLGLQPAAVVTARQVHGAHVAAVRSSDGGTIIPETDALISDEPGVALLLRFADCVPVVLYDPQRQAIGLAHAGWRGWVAGVVQNTVSALQSAFGSQPADLVAGVGPAIGPCCYEVGPDVVAAVERIAGAGTDLLRRPPDGVVHLDLPGAVRWQLQRSGVRRIEDSGLCTHCRTDEFFSHRAEHGHTGRFAAVVALQDSKRAHLSPRGVRACRTEQGGSEGATCVRVLWACRCS